MNEAVQRGRVIPPSAATWGKSPENLAKDAAPYPLPAHHLDTALVIKTLFDEWLRPGLRDRIVDAVANGDLDQARRTVMLIGALHDVGKANPLFQLQPLDSRAKEWRDRLAVVLEADGLLPASDIDITYCKVHGKSPARRHEYVGFKIVSDVFPSPSVSVAEHWLSVIIGGHHGRWATPDGDANGVIERLTKDAWDNQQQAQVSLSESATGMTTCVPHLEAHPAVPVILLSGLLILADWIASDDDFVSAGTALRQTGVNPLTDPQAWLETRAQEASDHALRMVSSINSLAGAESIILDGNVPRPLQNEALQLGPTRGLWTVMYPTGEGKTEAALLRHAACPDEGMIFALPTRATTDAMDDRLNKILSQTGNPVYLSHQFAGAKQSPAVCCDDLNKSAWFTTSIRRLVAPFVAATCDQVLTGALTQRHATLRLLALANHHVIIDEIHTFDAYQMELVIELLSWLGATDTRVTLLSATLPEHKTVSLRDAYAAGAAADAKMTAGPYEIAYPSHNLLDPDTNNDMRGPVLDGPVLGSSVLAIHMDLEWSTDIPQTLVDWASLSAQQHPKANIAVVANTVSDAIKCAQTLAVATNNHEVICLHSRMTLAHRNEIEEGLRTRLGREASLEPRPVIVVGTQVIEASLDIDFDLMASVLAPAPSLVQRAGRLWRFGAREQRTTRAGSQRTLHIVCPQTRKDPGKVPWKGALPYFGSELERVVAYLRARPVVRVPEDVQVFVETDRPMSPEDLEGAMEELGAEQVRLMEASRSKAELRALVARVAAGRRSLKWLHLSKLTELNDDEELMRTRYIDAPSHVFLLFDSRTASVRSKWARAGSVRSTIMQGSANDVLPLLDVSVPVSRGLGEKLFEVHRLTLAHAGIDTWEPRSRMLNGLLPLDLALIGGIATYEDLTGLTPALVGEAAQS